MTHRSIFVALGLCNARTDVYPDLVIEIGEQTVVHCIQLIILEVPSKGQLWKTARDCFGLGLCSQLPMQRDELLSVRHPKWTPCSSTLRLPRSCISTLRTALIFSHLHYLEVPLRCRAHALTLVDPNEQAPERTDWLSHCAALTNNSQIGCSTALLVRVLSQVDPNEQAPDLTDRLFRLGSKLLLQHLPSILSGKAMQAALPQPHGQATHAAKVHSFLHVRAHNF